MALISCPECGKEISDKSKVCIHCGYPIEEDKDTVYKINGTDYNLEKFIHMKWGSKLEFIKKIREITNCDLPTAKKIVDNLDSKGLVTIKPLPQENIPRCPTCNSTNLSKISNVKKATKIGLFGIFGAGDIGKTWKCNNCGSKF